MVDVLVGVHLDDPISRQRDARQEPLEERLRSLVYQHVLHDPVGEPEGLVFPMQSESRLYHPKRQGQCLGDYAGTH